MSCACCGTAWFRERLDRMPLDRDPHRIVIAGASSLLGAELKLLLEESRFAASEFRLLDEEWAAGTLTEAGGEAAVIQPVEEGSFDRARFIFFTGSANFTRANLAGARASGAAIIDLSGALADEPGTVVWFPGIDGLRSAEFQTHSRAYTVLSAAATAASALTLGLAPHGLRRLTFTAFQPVSEAGRAGIEELESQTSHLLSFQSIGKPVFDTQVAFTMLDRFGFESSQKLSVVRDRIRTEIRAALAGKGIAPAVQILHAPVFYGSAFSACAEVDPTLEQAAVIGACGTAGFALIQGDGPSNVSAAGESLIQLAVPELDPSQPGTWWFWGAADNIRLPAANAVQVAGKLADKLA
jgi:aspartate-semialdehyde dehydrogenase